MFRDDIPCTYRVVKNWGQRFRLCRTRDREIRNMPTSRPSYRITPDWSAERHLSEAHGGWHDSYLLIPSSSPPLESRLWNSSGIPAGPGIVTRSQFVCSHIRTYVGHVIHGGIIHATNPRYQKMPEGYTRVLLRIYVYMCRPHIHMPPILDRSMGYLEMGPGIM